MSKIRIESLGDELPGLSSRAVAVAQGAADEKRERAIQWRQAEGDYRSVATSGRQWTFKLGEFLGNVRVA